ncbi:ATP-binding protein [Bifidobacterium sp. MA2]|uniref:ATP-binding protein n=1 Tax=Bifidobacterium santillanense TaxID=2809028 RepID=A0ABS5UPD3_9BIFI|nr:ATP-binding protein [Bifidobacterium santillanense]MBT1172739.1 ATP-binding protein [Bifidobacterium santillanense]
MSFPANPFKPTAGVMPPVLIGRESVSLDFREGLDDGPGAPDRLMLITGPRGSGKTVMLTELGMIARSRRWEVIDETASDGLCDRLIARIAPEPSRIAGATIKPSVMGVSLGEFGIVPALRPSTLRDAMTARLRTLGKGRGLLITIDETQDASLEDMTAIAIAAQHMLRDNADVAFVFAGLPSLVSDLLNAKVLTFLRRASIKELGDVPLDDVRRALADTIRGAGVAINDEALDLATRATGGYPYMIQLVGYSIWRRARRRESTDGHAHGNAILTDDVKAGVEQARAKLGEGVCAPVVKQLSGRAVDYLRAMALDDGPSSSSDVAARMHESMDYANIYRQRLLDKHVIVAPARGRVDFAIPFLREYLRSTAADPNR